MKKFFKHLAVPILLFFGVFLIYKNIYPDPRNWYDHYLHLANSLMAGKVDVVNLPDFYQDKINFDGRTFIPFPPGASLAIIPFLIFFKTITQQQVSIILGSLNIALFYILFKKFTSSKNSILLSLFIAFGTSFFWSSVVGTTWFFAHIVATGFLLTSLIFHFNNKNLLSGVFFALAGLTRLPIVASGLFFVFMLKNRKKGLVKFLLGSSIFIVFYFLYNYLRFENIFENGYKTVYEYYTKGNIAYSIQRIWFPKSPHLNYFDPRAIIYHLYTLFIMPPESFRPSPYGMGIIFTSPLFLLVFSKKVKKKMEKALFLGIIPVFLLVSMHYAQGWVQFGYRFILDYIVFLGLILALKFKVTKLNLTLLFVSIAVNFWGVIWAIQLGW